MRSRFAGLIAALVSTLALAGVALAGDGGRPLSTPMSGAEEAPGPGDPTQQARRTCGSTRARGESAST